MIIKELGKRGSGQFILPGLLRMRVVRKPATKARPGRNPFTGEAMTIKAKPARNVVRATPSKALKDRSDSRCRTDPRILAATAPHDAARERREMTDA